MARKIEPIEVVFNTEEVQRIIADMRQATEEATAAFEKLDRVQRRVSESINQLNRAIDKQRAANRS